MLYQSKHVCAAADISRPDLNNWLVRGIVSPEVPAQGSGRPAKFSTRDLMFVAALARLRDMGMAPADAEGLAEQVARDAARYLLIRQDGNAARPTVEEVTWRLYWHRVPEGWAFTREPDPSHPQITIDAAAMAEDAMGRLLDNFPFLEGHN